MHYKNEINPIREHFDNMDIGTVFAFNGCWEIWAKLKENAFILVSDDTCQEVFNTWNNHAYMHDDTGYIKSLNSIIDYYVSMDGIFELDKETQKYFCP